VTVQNNVLVRIEPGPVAARVAGVLTGLRDVRASFEREARICRELARAGAPVPAPLDRAEAFVHHGRTVTLWEWLDGTTGAGEPVEAARALYSCHEALGSVSEPLDPWEGLREARESFAPRAPTAVLEELERLGAEAHGCVSEIRDGLRPVHGDAYPGNLMWTERGPILIDWEDAHLAPVEWDLACLVYYARTFGSDFGWADAALDAYGGDWDDDRLERCLTARGFQGAAYVAALSGERPELGERLEARLAWLRERLPR
jgi:Ser/Thr protein kinase RdoA (MazF antagonist)